MLPQRARDLLHRLDAGPHGVTAPLIEEFAGNCGRLVAPGDFFHDHGVTAAAIDAPHGERNE